MILPREEKKNESALLKTQTFTSKQRRQEHEMLGVNYETSVYRELPHFGSVQPNREKMNNFKIETGCQISVWSYFCVNLIFPYSVLTHLFHSSRSFGKAPIFFYTTCFFYNHKIF